MAETRVNTLSNQLDVEQILLEAQHRWLRPAEICEILRNYKKFRIAPEPPNMPPSGSLFLFDRKVLRFFRRDGHNWRKKKDGKTVGEAHEILKAGSVDVLHCYYAHGEENVNFQRRSYWMLNEKLEHIVLVHYREVKGNWVNFNLIKEAQETEETIHNSAMESSVTSVSSSFHPNNYQMPSQTTDSTSLNSVQASEYEAAESVCNHQSSSRFNSLLELQQPTIEKIDAGRSDIYDPVPFQDEYQGMLSAIPGMHSMSLAPANNNKDTNDAVLTFEPRKHLDFYQWVDVLENCPPGVEPVPFQPSFSSTQLDTMGYVPKQGHEILGQHVTNSFGRQQEFGSHLSVHEEWQLQKEDDIAATSEWQLQEIEAFEGEGKGKGKAKLDRVEFTPTVALERRKAELALRKLTSPALHKLTSSQIEGVDKAIINAITLIWEDMDNITKHCVKHCALYPKGKWIDKSSLISHWIKDHLVYSHDEGNFVLRSLTNAFLVEDVGNHVRLKGEIYDVLVNLLVSKMHPMFLKQGDFEKTKSMKEEEWNAKEIYLMDNELYDLPESPNCPSLIALYLQRNYDLTIIPPLFFEHMPVLQVLDLSHTSIKSLPESLPKLVALRKLVLRGCELFMELSPQVGELKNLEELDLEETQIIYLPVEIGKLVKLKRLRASFYGDMNCNKKILQSSTVIHTGVISNLSQLTELSIHVNPDDERWNGTVEAIIEEICSSKMLNTLSLYLPKVELLKKLGRSLIYRLMSRFSFVVGHHKRRIISRVPDEVEARFKEWDKCLKFVNGRDIPDEVTEVLRYATAFYLDRNATAVNLSESGIEDIEKLKFCILAECNEMQTIIDRGEFYEEGSDKEEGNESCCEFEYDSDSFQEVVLGSLLYLGIYYMNNLRSIWKGPIHGCCLSNLKFLAIHTCPKLSTIFSVDLLANLIKLEELIIEDCPQVTCLVSHASSNPASVNYLPSLRNISLLFLPELVSISSGLHIAPELERISFYYCPKLENLSTTELSSKNLKVIKGERKWWDEALKWNESDWGSRPDHLNDIFHEIDEEKDVMTQLTEQE